METSIKTPVTIYIVHHPESKDARVLASRLYDWFRLGHLSGESTGVGLPVYFRRQLSEGDIHPQIKFEDAKLNVIIPLVDHRMVVDPMWRSAIVSLAEKVDAARKNKHSPWRALLLPAAMHESFYRTGPLYGKFNPVRLLGLEIDAMEATLRRAATEATARMLRAGAADNPPPLNVFLSHAKRDGTAIAETIRDGVRSFGQLVAWYDANDLPFGSTWDSPMTNAAKNDTAAMIATVTDAYPTRPWCRKEAKLARTPVCMEKRKGSRRISRVWKVQPVVAIHQPKTKWIRGVPMLEGVPRVGWDDQNKEADTERIVDRLVLEVLLGHVNRMVAQDLDQAIGGKDSCFITWVPDAWTLAAMRQQLGTAAASIRRIIYPGYGMTVGEQAEIEPVISSFHAKTKLVSFEEVWE